MGHSKKGGKKGPAPKKSAAKGAARNGSSAGGAAQEFEDSDGEIAGDANWLEEQRRLLERFRTEKEKEETVTLLSKEARQEEVVEQQRRLLEQAEARKAGGASLAATVGSGQAPGEGGASSGRSDGAVAPGSAGAGAGAGSGVAAVAEETFAVRSVAFCGRQVPMLLQNRNGPCALLAVANCLLMRGTLTLAKDEVLVSSSTLVERLAQLCEQLNAKQMEEDPNMREGISEVIQRLPLLLDGLLLNCGFASCTDFELTADLGLFDCLSVKLYHVWVAPEVAKVAGSWNSLSEQLALGSELRETLEREGRLPTEEEDENLTRGVWLRDWLDETQAQATPEGLRELFETVEHREASVLFRNNHFCTVYKPSKEALVTLLTDAAFEEEANAVWESVELDGDTGHILDGDFAPYRPGGRATGGASVSTAGGARGKATTDEPSAAKKAELIALVEGMGFARELAEAGLAAVGWADVQQAVEAILEADGEMPKPRKVKPEATTAGGGGFSEVHSCPTCSRSFRSKNGALNHRASKGH
mmetsp:Transcript_85850/g.241566  ORF Transcript_85850/g.241566 Transcript_85850/m.241566 type:complete len:531 (-) Transcript_85850:43-1635(-)